MSENIFPRSPKEQMAGWYHLPRFLDKIRLHLAGRLPADYQENFTKGFDGSWLKAAGVTGDQMIEVVKSSITDGQVCDWVRAHAQRSAGEQQKFNDGVVNYGREGDELRARLKWRKEQAGLGHRDDIQTFFDFIDADEKRA